MYESVIINFLLCLKFYQNFKNYHTWKLPKTQTMPLHSFGKRCCTIFSVSCLCFFSMFLFLCFYREWVKMFEDLQNWKISIGSDFWPESYKNVTSWKLPTGAGLWSLKKFQIVCVFETNYCLSGNLPHFRLNMPATHKWAIQSD